MKGSFRDEACEVAVVPCGSFTLETDGARMAILPDAAFSAARHHIRHRRQAGFDPRTNADGGAPKSANGVNSRSNLSLISRSAA